MVNVCQPAHVQRVAASRRPDTVQEIKIFRCVVVEGVEQPIVNRSIVLHTFLGDFEHF